MKNLSIAVCSLLLFLNLSCYLEGGVQTAVTQPYRTLRHFAPAPLTCEQKTLIKNLTLDQAIEFAVQRNVDILHQLQEIERFKGIFYEVRASALPTLNANGFFNVVDQSLVPSTASLASLSSVNAFSNISSAINQLAAATGVTICPQILPSEFIDHGTLSNKSYQIALQVNQNIYTGGRVYHSIRNAALNEGNAFYQFREVVNRTILNVRNSFYQVLFYDALIDVQRETVLQLAAQLEDQKNRFAAGTVPRFNVLQAEVALANQEPQLIAAENNYQLSKLQLAHLIGVDSEPDSNLIANFNCVGKLVYEPQDFDVEKCVRVAIENRDLLKLDRQAVIAQNENIMVARSGFLPTITGNAGIKQQSTASTIERSLGGFFVGVQGTWNIFDGMATYGRIRQARALQYEAISTLDDAIRQVTQDVQSAYQDIIQAKETEVGQALNEETAREALRLAEARLGAGAGTQLDVLNAQQQLTVAQSTKLQAIYQYVSAVAGLEFSTGTTTYFNNNFSDPITRSHSQALIPIVDSTHRSVSKGGTPHIATPDQTEVQRASGMGLKPKIDADRSGQFPPPIAHRIAPPGSVRVPRTPNLAPKYYKPYSTYPMAPPKS